LLCLERDREGPQKRAQARSGTDEEGLTDEDLERMQVEGIDMGRVVRLVVKRVDSHEARVVTWITARSTSPASQSYVMSLFPSPARDS
jgi:hypothetical protein